MFAIAFPAIDPVLIQIGPIAIRWYALAYIAGLFAGLAYIRRQVAMPPALMTRTHVDDLFLWVLGGVILGGRFGYVFFYKPGSYLSDPLSIFKTWEGGMSFHGGLVGVIIAILLFARTAKVNKWYVGDRVACAVPIGLGLGRLANFINGELWGRVAPDVPWAMVFPGAGELPRHPSQLYQAALEGLVLFMGVFLIGYGAFRIFGELFREPDSFLGFLPGGTTMGQWLSVPMILFGLFSIWRARRVGPVADKSPAPAK